MIQLGDDDDLPLQELSSECPQREPWESLAVHQDAVASWAGYDSRDDLNADHDPLHEALCGWLGVESHALRQAKGEWLSRDEQHLANLEEAAVLATQRFLKHAGASVPQGERR